MKPSLKSTLSVVGVLLVGAIVSYGIATSAPKPGRKAPDEQARLVDAAELKAVTTRPKWRTGGVVQAAEQATLSPQVSGAVIALTPQSLPGQRVKKGALLANIDSADYQLLVRQRQAALIQAQADLEVERGEAALAREEYQLSAQQLSPRERALVLREPQVARAEAAVRKAQADLEQAQLNLARTEIRMPFDGQIISRQISTGSQVSAGSALFDVVRSDVFWVEVKVPRQFLSWVDDTQAVEVRQPNWPQGQVRQARIVSLLPDVDSADRQSRLLLAIDQPLAAQPQVLVNDYVDVVLTGKPIDNAYEVAVGQLNDDDSLWLIRAGELQRLQPEIVYRGREQVWLRGDIQAGDQLLLSRIDAVTDGMKVRTTADNG